MKKISSAILLFLFPALIFADSSSLSFAPPASDLSVVFLGNLFGVVDGVLHGSGSQIMGTMFGVFNAAVLALGGIVIMYTLIVGTMNTAHEGQMLGQKWSSIWIPVRSTLGLALLIPKASGYCLMQIFVMWIVVQGIGAADKVWEAALSYLNRGGVIIKTQTNPALALTKAASSGVSDGALTILAGQVCMLGLQKQLELLREAYLSAKQNNSGPCSGTPSPAMKDFCTLAVPDFVGTVNAVMMQDTNKTATSFKVPMPNFDPSIREYAFLNGICGNIQWNAIPKINAGVGSGKVNISTSELSTAQMSRAIAIQQMYLQLSTVARVMVNNSPSINPPPRSDTSGEKPYSLVAKQQFGVPYTRNKTICTEYSQFCAVWGPAGGDAGVGVLFNGTEFQGAISDYNTIMSPTLNLIQQAKDSGTANDARKFIKQAESQGWMMAGSYFFDLIKIQGSATNDPDGADTDTGLKQSTINPNDLTSAFTNPGCKGTYSKLCAWFGEKNEKLSMVVALIDGSILRAGPSGPVASDPITRPDLNDNPKRRLINDLQSSTVYGFANNSIMVQLPGQPGLKPLLFADVLNFNVDPTMLWMKPQNFPCGAIKVGFVFSFCFGQMMGNLFYNIIFVALYNSFLLLFQQFLDQIFMAFFMIPLTGMSDIFKMGIATISKPGVNPVIALANMGTQYINFAGGMWIKLLTISILGAIIPLFGFFVMPLLALAMPIVMCWLGVMVGIGFVTAYYVPLLPYIIFTFGTIGWLIAVIEAMVAAPIVALGITHPEGNEALGKSEHAIMILMNVFLRPAMMIIGYISAIALSYVGVWVLNAGFDHAIGFIQQSKLPADYDVLMKIIAATTGAPGAAAAALTAAGFKLDPITIESLVTGSIHSSGSGTGGYTGWAGIFAFFFSILSYTTLYLLVVQKSFILISLLPDKVLRWIGGAPESIGSETAQWGEELKQSAQSAGKEAFGAQQQVGKQLGGYGGKAISAVSTAGKGAGKIAAKGLKE